MEVEFMTADTTLPPCMPLPRAMLRLPISSTAKVMYARMLDIVFVSGIEDTNGILFIHFPIVELAAALARSTMDKLCTVDEYPSDSILFTAYGYALHIHDELVAAAFASLPEQEQGILILHCVLGLADGEIGSLVGMSRSAVQRHRTKALNELRKRLEEERRKPK